MSDYDRNSVRWGQGATQSQGAIDQGLRSYMIGVYNNMMLGLAVTGIVAFAVNYATVITNEAGRVVALTPLGETLFTSGFKWVVIFAPLGFVLLLQSQFQSWSSATLRLGFFVYASLVGVSMAFLLIIYQAGSIANAFFITASCFGAVSIYGYTTKRDLTAIGSFCLMGLWGAIIASVVGLFFHSSILQTGISVVVVLVSAGLQAWSNQEVRSFYYAGGSQEEMSKKSIFGALWMYINFVNMFTSILQLTGSRR